MISRGGSTDEEDSFFCVRNKFPFKLISAIVLFKPDAGGQ